MSVGGICVRQEAVWPITAISGQLDGSQGRAVDCKPILDSGVSTLISPPHILSPPAASGHSDDTFTARSVLEMMMLFIHKLQWLYIIFCDSMKQHGAQEQI